MKIAILGTRGIPNNYGGFEQCAEKIGEYFVSKGHEVTVYNPDEHPYNGAIFKEIRIKKIFSKESKLGIWGTFAYDYLCLRDAVKEDFDIILNLGYVPSALFFRLKKKTKAKFVTNMDGLEWKRSKWNGILKRFIKFCEKRAVKFSDFLIADNPGIESFYVENYGVGKIRYIPYGAEPFNGFDESVLNRYNLKPYSYFMLIARLEPENNIETILDGYVESEAKEPFLVVGGLKNKYADYLLKKFENYPAIKFVGGIYHYPQLCSLRKFSKLYFHGHSVGGTNPSLLEAMASHAFIVAHDNPFNRYVLGSNAYYFSDKGDIAKIIKSADFSLREKFVKNNLERIEKEFSWEKVASDYLNVFLETAGKN